MLDTFNTILVLAPHTDDGEFGCGATISQLTAKQKKVIYVAFSTCEASVPSGFPADILATEVKKATAILGIPPEHLLIKDYPVRYFPSHRQAILEDLVQLNRQYHPDLVFCPCSFDVHQDHNTIYQEAKRAFKRTTILGYELPWNNFSFTSTCYIKQEQAAINKKIEAIQAYASQQRRSYSAQKAVQTIADFRGGQISVPQAEAFEVIRWIIG